MFHTVLLKCFDRIQGERSLSSVYHLLTGKRSTQTIQDAKLFQIEGFFGVYPTLNRVHYDREIKKLQKDNLVYIDEKLSVLLTADGKESMESKLSKSIDLDWLNGYEYHKIASPFWNRLLLFIQTTSNMMNQQNEFVPIVDEDSSKRWVRQYFHHNRNKLDLLFTDLYDELMLLLDSMPNSLREVLVSRMSGFNIIGLSKEQIADQLQVSPDDLELYLQAGIHYMINTVTKDCKTYNVLSAFIPESTELLPLTSSARKTLMFYRQGIPITGIAVKRKLKMSTIQDHIIEIAVVEPNFSIAPFVPKEMESIILSKVKELQTKRLKVIKDNLPKEVEYFDIRLVIAKHFSG